MHTLTVAWLPSRQEAGATIPRGRPSTEDPHRTGERDQVEAGATPWLQDIHTNTHAAGALGLAPVFLQSRHCGFTSIWKQQCLQGMSGTTELEPDLLSHQVVSQYYSELESRLIHL